MNKKNDSLNNIEIKKNKQTKFLYEIFKKI